MFQCIFSIVNDIIFGYHIFMFITWFFINILDVLAVLVIYSLYIELTGVSKLENLAKIKVTNKMLRKNIKNECSMNI